MNMDQVKELVSLEKEKDSVESQLALIKDRIKDLKTMLLPQFLKDACQSVKADGRLVHLFQDVSTKIPPDVERKRVAQALKDADLATFVEENFNLNSVNAYMRELGREVKEECLRDGVLFDEDALQKRLPPQLQKVLKVGFYSEIRVRKG